VRNRISTVLATIVLATIAVFLAVDVGYSLYQPDRLDTALPSCTLDIISGDIKVMKKDGLSWTTASDGMLLEPGSRVRTNEESQASLVFSRGTTTKLEPGTDVVIAELGDTTGTQSDIIVLRQQTGKTWNLVEKSDSDCSFRIKTSSADIKVHGTAFSAEIDDSGKTWVETAEGEVAVHAEDEEVRVLAGEMTTVGKGSAPAAPAAIPRPTNELIFTIDKPVLALVTDPGGSSSGYLDSDSKINQISGSRIVDNDEFTQSIRIRNARTGEYTVILRGVTDASYLNVEGFAEGKSAFVHSESSNVTSAGDLIVKLHCEVLDGVLQSVSVMNPSSQKKTPTLVYSTSAAPQATPGTETAASVPADEEFTAGNDPWDGIARGPEGPWGWTNNLFQYLTAACIVVLLGGLYVFIYRRN
jgi:hypothetical protein